MRITDLLTEEGIILGARAGSKSEVIERLVERMAQTGRLRDKAEYLRCVLAREKEGTTGIGEGVAIPHAKTHAVRQAGLCAMVLPDGVDYQSLDGEATRLIFLIAAPDTAQNIHLDVLGRLSVLLMDDAFRQRLLRARNKREFMQAVDEAENAQFAQEDAKAAARETAGEYRLLAVTACPTGIAHTYMAAENLQNQAKELGVSLKVETDGSGGVKNRLTKEEIAAAECIIVAADKNVEMARFDGKPVIQTGVAAGIHKGRELLEQAMVGNAPIYHSTEERAAAGIQPEGWGRRIYKHLMNGVSHMLPFVIGGGILIALSFLFDNYELDPAGYGSNTPFAAFLNTVGNFAFSFMLPVLAGYIAMSIGDRPALAMGFVGGLAAKEGGAGFLGALLAGFLAGYLAVGLRRLFSRLPRALEGTKPVLLYPFLGILAVGAAMLFLVNPPMEALNNLMTQALQSMGGVSRVLLGIVLAAMMAIDMGGPINKAAYVFGTAAIASGQYEVMAAVMIGGMVPPLALALSTAFFQNRYTEKERQTTLTNLIMGLSFITEGAIPFAAADPLRVIPSCAVGAAAAGGLSMFFACTLRAPHGGIFVIPVVGNPLMYLLALAVGAVVGMLMLALLKRPIRQEA